ncbi:hypothetical protein Vadar_003732 [Vaccinium darrowii]|uniref:Uncharacterized protein n=1 Tax=Vaccinium darrowii TaxID=229202 RepID=A0ACB7YSV8_9ERIC|nr:hypothetical protein Vadar_003732 [Vaccinium darrowii]
MKSRSVQRLKASDQEVKYWESATHEATGKNEVILGNGRPPVQHDKKRSYLGKINYKNFLDHLLNKATYLTKNSEVVHDSGKATQQSDVYAFRIVLLEIVCGLQPGISIDDFYCSVDWIWFLYREGRILDAVEKRLADEYVVEEAQKVLILALACCHPIAGERPKTQAIVQILSGLVSVPYVLPFKPAFVWPSMPSMDEDDNCTMETSSYQTTQLRSDFNPQCINRVLCAIDSQCCVGLS